MDKITSPTGSSGDESGTGGGVPIKSPFASRSARNPVVAEEQCHEPRGPPTGADLIATKGFARFIARHKSPPHVRVTAGGRIVPVGPTSPPQTFHMDFIDRIIQAAEQVEQDPDPQRLVQPVNWFEAIDGINHHLGQSENFVGLEAEPISPICDDFHGVHYGEAGAIVLPDGVQECAIVIDGSKVVQFAGMLYRALVDVAGQTVMEALDPHKSWMPRSSCNTLPGHPQGSLSRIKRDSQNSSFNQDQRDGTAGVTVVNDQLGKMPMYVPPHLDPSGNPSWDDIVATGFSIPQESQWVMAPSNEVPNENTLRSLVTVGQAERQYLPSGPTSRSYPAHERRVGSEASNAGHSNLSLESLSKKAAFVQKMIDERAGRLKAVERWLAKESDTMDSTIYHLLVEEKGEHIRGIDRFRKEQEKIARQFRAAKAKAHRAVEQILRPNNFQLAHGVPQDASRSHVSGSGAPVSSQYGTESKLLGASDLPRDHRSMQNIPTFAQTMHEGHKIVYYPQQQDAVPQAQMHASTSHHLSSQQTSAYGRRNMIAPESMLYRSLAPQGFLGNNAAPFQPALSDHTSLENKKATDQPGACRAKTAISLRHPDGTPIDLEQIRKANQASNAATNMHEPNSQQGQIPGLDRSLQTSKGTKLGASLTNSKAVPASGAHTASAVKHDDPHEFPVPEINWGRLPNENDIEYRARTEYQRKYQTKYGVVGSNGFQKKEPASIQRPKTNTRVYTDENQQFRRPPLPTMAPAEHFQVQVTGMRSTTDPGTSRSTRNAVMLTPTNPNEQSGRREMPTGYNTAPVRRFKPNAL